MHSLGGEFVHSVPVMMRLEMTPEMMLMLEEIMLEMIPGMMMLEMM